MADTDATSNPEMSNQGVLEDGEEKLLNVGEVFKQYDSNTDGKIDHLEYIKMNKPAKGSGGVSGVMDRLLHEDPALRGQRLWVMFALSVVLIAGMNAYAMVREPELVKIGDLIEHTNEVVRVEGIVVSWVEDPYGSGEDRTNIIIEDDTGVAQLRWYRPGEVPMLGTKVTATGDVIEYEGRIWLQALGSGALSWDDDDVPDAPLIGISTIAADPASYAGESFTIEGFLSKAVDPDATFTPLYLGDHPEYSSSEHQMRMVIYSAPGQWLESGQKVEVTAMISYEQSELRWVINVEGPEIRVVRSHTPIPTQLEWVGIATWSYSSGNLVTLVGLVEGDVLVGPDGNTVCMRNAGNLSSFQNKEVMYNGRLIWSVSNSGWCIDASMQTNSSDSIDVTQAQDFLMQLIYSPHDTLNDSAKSTHYIISGHVYGSELISSLADTKIIISDKVYPDINVKIDAYIATGLYSGWLEDGQALVMNVTARWDNSNARIVLDVHDLNLSAPAPDPNNNPFDLISGAPEWYALDKMTTITGNLEPYTDYIPANNDIIVEFEGNSTIEIEAELSNPIAVYAKGDVDCDSFEFDAISENTTIDFFAKDCNIGFDSIEYTYLGTIDYPGTSADGNNTTLELFASSEVIFVNKTFSSTMYLQKEGGSERIRIDIVSESIGTDSIHENLTLTWTGRLIEVADNTVLAHYYLLSEADVTDSDGDGLSDEAELALGFNPELEDTDDDGETDRYEVENPE